MSNGSQTRLVVLVLLALGALLLVPVLAMATGVFGFGHMGGWMWGDGMWGGRVGWMMLVGVVMQILFLVVVVGGIVLLYRALTDSSGASDQALEELRTAYARGDIDDGEFERRRERLERDS